MYKSPGLFQSWGAVIFTFSIVLILFGTASALIYINNRAGVPVPDEQAFQIEVVSLGQRHLFFRKDRGGLRTEELIDVEYNLLGAPPSVTKYLFFYNTKTKGYDVFREEGGLQNRERLETLPAYVNYYWGVGQQMALKREPNLFAEGPPVKEQ